MKIKDLKARQILDSRGNYTVEVSLFTDNGEFKASCPSGDSTGKKEALELRDADGGVLEAVSNVNEKIYPLLKNEDILNQEVLDKKMIELDGTGNKSNLGANAILPVSIAALKAAASHYSISPYSYIEKIYGKRSLFPLPSFNIINGGAHAGNNLDIQEFMVIPQGERYSDNLSSGASIYNKLKKLLRERYGKEALNVGDEGGFAPFISRADEALDLIKEVIDKDVRIGLDCAASYYYKSGEYHMEKAVFTREGLIKFYNDLIQRYPIDFIEDPFDEDDIESWKRSGEIKDAAVIGDDLTVTNEKLIREASSYINGVIIKLNQIGTVTETINAIKEARKNNLKIIVSHRSGETTDSFIADLAVGVSADYIKTGAPARGERVVKYNRLLEIYEELKNEE